MSSDADGNMLTMTDLLGGTTQYFYDRRASRRVRR